MKFKVIKAENPKFATEPIIENDELENKKVGEKIKFNGDELIITQIGEVYTLVGKRGDVPVLYVLQRIYEEQLYITDYKDIKEPDHLIVNDNEKVFVVKHPMSLEALFKYIRYHAPTPEPSINMVGNNTFEFVNGWRLYGSDSHRNIKDGRYSYESKAITTDGINVWKS